MLPSKTPNEIAAAVRQELEAELEAEFDAHIDKLADDGDMDALVTLLAKVTAAIQRGRVSERGGQ